MQEFRSRSARTFTARQSSPTWRRCRNLLVAGTTGSGKSVCINALIASMLFASRRKRCAWLSLIQKMVEMQAYQSLPHLAFPIVTDPKKVLLALRWLIDEMERRYRMFARAGVRNIVGFNAEAEEENTKRAQRSSCRVRCLNQIGRGVPLRPRTLPRSKYRAKNEEVVPDRIPYVVVIVDELADLMQTAAGGCRKRRSRASRKWHVRLACM